MRRLTMPTALAFVLTLTGAACADTFVVAVGVDRYEHAPQLSACVKDAKDIQAFFAPVANTCTYRLTDDAADSENIFCALSDVRGKAKDGDLTILHLSGHGGGSRTTPFYFYAYDGPIRWSELTAALAPVKGTVVVMLDACHAGSATGSPNAIVFAGCKAEGYCGETAGGNGWYTTALLAGLSGDADANGDGRVTVDELAAFSTWKALQVSAGRQHPVVLRPADGSGGGVTLATVTKAAMPEAACGCCGVPGCACGE